MMLYTYFKKKTGNPLLPDVKGQLSTVVPSSYISEANKEVSEATKKLEKRGPYMKLTPEKKADIGKYAAENGIVSAVRRFSKDFPGGTLKETTVHGWKVKYLSELGKRKREGGELVVKTLPVAKIGRPLLLGEDLNKKVQNYLFSLRDVGGVINTAIVRAAAAGMVKRKDPRLLASNGGHISLSKDWARYMLQRIGFVKRKGTTKAKSQVDNFDELKYQFLFDIKVIVAIEEVPPCLVINWDQTGIKYVPVSNWTMAKQGAKKVEIVGVSDKRQITAVFAGTLSGTFLPPQIIYKGKTKACLPDVAFPNDWHITFSHNHWANETTVKDYITNIIVPYVLQKKEELKLHSEQRAVCIIDNFSAQCTDDVLELLERHKIDTVLVPPNCTGELQPMDVSINKPVKDILKKEFHQWYSDEVSAQGEQYNVIKLPLSVMKPLGAKWLMKAFDHIQSHPKMIINGFKAPGITGIIDELSRK